VHLYAGQFAHTLQQLQLQQQLLLNKPLGFPSLSKSDAPLHVNQQQYGAYDNAKQPAPGQYTSKALAPSSPATSQRVQPVQLQKPQQQPPQQQQQQQQQTGLESGSDLTAACGHQAAGIAPDQQWLPNCNSAVEPLAPAAGIPIKQEPGSPEAHSPSATAGPTANSSPTPEPSAAAPVGRPTGATAAGGRFKLSLPSPVPAPDESEGPAAAAEYSKYLERWEEGVTLAQRWFRWAQAYSGHSCGWYACKLL